MLLKINEEKYINTKYIIKMEKNYDDINAHWIYLPNERISVKTDIFEKILQVRD